MPVSTELLEFDEYWNELVEFHGYLLKLQKQQ